jgi:hypothetical protein
MRLNESELDEILKRLFQESYSMQNPSSSAPSLNNDTVLLETGLDSLGFAILITKLSEELTYDPFGISDESYYPKTYKELLDFCVKFQSE